MIRQSIILILIFLQITLSFSQNITKVSPSKPAMNLKEVVLTNNVNHLVNEHQKKMSATLETKISNFSEWEKGFISGLIATLIGFFLTMIWDIYKNRRDKIAKDRIIKKLILDSLTENELYKEQNNVALKYELGLLNQGQNLVNNLGTLKNDFWELIKFNIPKNLLKNNNSLKVLQDISSLTKSINETINSREMYRLNNGAFDNLQTRLRHYDEMILIANEKLKGLISAFKKSYV